MDQRTFVEPLKWAKRCMTQKEVKATPKSKVTEVSGTCVVHIHLVREIKLAHIRSLEASPRGYILIVRSSGHRDFQLAALTYSSYFTVSFIRSFRCRPIAPSSLFHPFVTPARYMIRPPPVCSVCPKFRIYSHLPHSPCRLLRL